MSHSEQTVEQSYRYCRRLCRRAKSSFSIGFRLLPPEKRRAMEALYAFMRFTDDLADSFSSVNVFNDPVRDADEKKRNILTWRACLDSCFSDSFSKKDEKSLLPPDFKTSENHVGRSILPALVDTMERFEIPAKYVFAIIDGAIQDLEKNRYAAFDELEKYCELVASAVGLACIHVWGFAGRGTPEQEKVFELARRVGIAYQLTNILRDVKEDAAMDRVYLPQDDLNAAGYSVEELKRGVVNPCLLKLMQIEIGLAEEYYQSSRELYCHINPDGRKLFGLMTGTYHTLLTKIARNPAAVLSKRIRLVFFERLRLARRWMGKLPQELEW